jgi:hypothetical protein
MTGLVEWAEVDDLLCQMGASGELRAELLDRYRGLSLLGDDLDRVMEILAISVLVLPLGEAELRAFGHEALADEVARFTVALSLWLELPAGLAVFAGHPVFPE